ncbi:RNA-binding protein 28 isoform X3 [Nelusetta ayraudi]|uniref:RNA-binding protein 28 isoform X3 n=1 Tax=Nelusetta ayraudi TaxID=303726 RepID=UPI003F7189FB
MPAQTLFVNGLPATASNERLAEIFSEIGPVKQCFVVRQKDAEKCRGFGYVTYSMAEDSQRALKEIKDYDGQRISVSVAKKKQQDQKKTGPKETPAADKTNKESFTGSRKNKLKSRLIIRNLSFQCSEDDLKNVCSKFGEILEVNIPLKPDGKMRGFAFVLFKNMSGAGKALNALNMKEIKGRQVAVDWAVPKDRFLATQSPSSAGNKEVPAEKTAEQSDSDDDDDEEEEEEEAQKPAAPQKKKVASKAAVQQVKESHSDEEEEGSEDEDEGTDEEEEEEEEDDQSGSGSNDDGDDEVGSDDDDDDDEEEDDDEDDEEEEEEYEDDEEDKSGGNKATKKPLPSDVNQGRTVFIRNLSFDTEEEGLKEALQKYGDLNYSKIVMHPETDHSKGCAFAQFKTKEAAEACIAASQEESQGGIRLDGRKLFIVLAVSKEDATKLKVNKVKVETGTRNLYLAREGLIRAGTSAAEGVSEADKAKRARFEDLKRTKLRDINVYVSKTRLCVHNLPKFVDNKKLRAVCLAAVKETKGVRIVECRVMYDKKPVKNQVMGQSLGYGFVQFQQHEHALSTLRHLNNNPDIFGPGKRPIVEFSLEDSRKLKIKELRMQKNKEFSKDHHFNKGARQSQAAGVADRPEKGGKKAQASPGQQGKEKAAPRAQKREGGYSGFKTKPEVEHVELQDGKKRRKVLAFPSHRGPKIRMRDKGKQKAPPAKRAKPGSQRRDRPRQQMEKPMQPRNQKGPVAKKQPKRRDSDRFDSLVEQYKKKLLSSGGRNAPMKRNKWFDS